MTKRGKSTSNYGMLVYISLWYNEQPLSASAINPNEKSYTYEGFKETVTPKAMTIRYKNHNK
jgi:N-ethylmaleimide reductase